MMSIDSEIARLTVQIAKRKMPFDRHRQGTFDKRGLLGYFRIAVTMFALTSEMILYTILV